MELEVEGFDGATFWELIDRISKAIEPSEFCRKKVVGISHSGSPGYYSAIVIIAKEYD